MIYIHIYTFRIHIYVKSCQLILTLEWPGGETQRRDGFATDANVVAMHTDAGASQETSTGYTARLPMACGPRRSLKSLSVAYHII